MRIPQYLSMILQDLCHDIGKNFAKILIRRLGSWRDLENLERYREDPTISFHDLARFMSSSGQERG